MRGWSYPSEAEIWERGEVSKVIFKEIVAWEEGGAVNL